MASHWLPATRAYKINHQRRPALFRNIDVSNQHPNWLWFRCARLYGRRQCRARKWRHCPPQTAVLGGISIDSSVEGAAACWPQRRRRCASLSNRRHFGGDCRRRYRQSFPPSEPQWRGASSDQFLAYAAGPRLSQKGGEIINIDATIICERPKIGPFVMRCARIAEICGIDIGQVSIKASTTERLGFTGRGEGIAARRSPQ